MDKREIREALGLPLEEPECYINGCKLPAAGTIWQKDWMNDELRNRRNDYWDEPGRHQYCFDHLEMFVSHHLTPEQFHKEYWK